MQSVIAERSSSAAAPPRRTQSSNDLAKLAAPVLELVLKLQTGAIAPSNDVRPVVANLLQQLEQGGVQIRCNPRQVQDVKFALVAFVDETILSPKSNFALRGEWEQYPLQLEYFKEHLAGVKFFERLDNLLANIETEVDAVEVYYLCLLLGFKGKYNIYLLENELKDVIKKVEDQLRSVGRLIPTVLSAHWLAKDQPEIAPDRGLPLWLKIGASAALALALFMYLIFYFLLQSDLTVVR